MVALGKTYAGLFSTSDELAEQLSKAGEATGWGVRLLDRLVADNFED
eukprot:gene22366-23502_t